MIIIQVLKDVTLPNGVSVKAGGVLTVPDDIGAALIQEGKARPRVQPGPTEIKDALPPQVPYTRVPAPPASVAAFTPGAYEDQDNFVRNLVTVTIDSPVGFVWPWDGSVGQDPPPVAQSPSASTRDPLLTLEEIKTHCHIELDQTDEDALLTQYEMAARLHTENYLRYQIDTAAGAPENVKQANLMLIAHWYRNRESVTTGRGYMGSPMPMAYMALLSLERDYPIY